jgi:hypothetical protein
MLWALRVFGALLENVLLGFSFRDEIAVRQRLYS